MHVSALYLPQFHPVEENNKWWGPGFTEWTNVAKARPLFPGHKQPVLPGELGFYDLRNDITRVEQAALAREHGVSSFTYWHYWFNGRKILEKPLEQVLRSPDPDFPFVVSWANETWQGRWYGSQGETLLEQTYPGDDDHRAHFEYLEPFFHDRRYGRLAGRPMMFLYKPLRIPQVERFVELWNTLAQQSGLGSLYWVGQVDSPTDAPKICSVLDQGYLNPALGWVKNYRNISSRVFQALKMPRLVDATEVPAELARVYKAVPKGTPCVIPSWDNTPRASRTGVVMWGANGELFEQQVRDAARHIREHRSVDEQLMVVKSWNEWAESNCLEPSRDHGRMYLEALQRGLIDPSA